MHNDYMFEPQLKVYVVSYAQTIPVSKNGHCEVTGTIVFTCSSKIRAKQLCHQVYPKSKVLKARCLGQP